MHLLRRGSLVGLLLCLLVTPAFADLNDGLVAYYPFNGNANDESVNDNHGSVSGAILTEDMYGNPNSAYLFDGLDDYINCGNSTDFNVGTQATYAAWFKKSKNLGYILSKWKWGAEDKALEAGSCCAWEGMGGFYLYNSFGGKTLHTNNLIEMNDWTHIAGTYDGSMAKIFINGELDNSKPASGNVSDSNANMYIGMVASAPDYYGGILDDIRVYNRALSDAEIRDLYCETPLPEECTNGLDDDCDGLIDDEDPDCAPPYPPNSHAAVYGQDSVTGSGLINQILLIAIPIGFVFLLWVLPSKSKRMFSILFFIILASFFFSGQASADLNDGLVGYWPFNGNANDESGNGNDGAVNGAVLTEDRFGNSNSAYDFDGDDDFINCGHSSDFNFNTAASFSIWINSAQGKFVYVLCKWTSGAEDKNLAINSSLYPRFYLYNVFGGSVLPTENPLALGEWFHIVGTYDGSLGKIYVNGQLENTKNASGNIADTSADMFIGKSLSTSTGNFNGKIDDVRIYNRALSEAEIQELYNYTPPQPPWGESEAQASSLYGKESTNDSRIPNGLIFLLIPMGAVIAWRILRRRG